MAFTEGDLLDGRYEFLRSLGQGGFAQVFLAQDLVLGRQVAIKFPHFVVNEDEEGHARFQREANILGQLCHKNVVSVYAHGRADDGTPYLVMEYVDGRPLSKVIQAGELTYDLLQSIICQVCDGLEHASQFGVVHRDLSPSNICVRTGTTGIEAKVIDFGLSRVFGCDSVAAGNLTQAMIAVGCPPYMSPELARGEVVDVRSDIYSLGCVLYECVSSKMAFESLSPARLLEMHQLEMPKQPELLPPFKSHTKLLPIILTCLQKDRQERYQNPMEIKEALISQKKSNKLVNDWSARIVTRRATLGTKRTAMLALCLTFIGVVMFAGLNDQLLLLAKMQMSQHSIAARWAAVQNGFSGELHEQIEAAKFAQAAHDSGNARKCLSNVFDVYKKHPDVALLPDDIRTLSILADDASRSAPHYDQDLVMQSLILEMAITTKNYNQADLPLASLTALLDGQKIPNDEALNALFSSLRMYVDRLNVEPSRYAKAFARASFVLSYGKKIPQAAQLAVLFCERAGETAPASELGRICGHPLTKAKLIEDSSLLGKLVTQFDLVVRNSHVASADLGLSYLILCIGTLTLNDEKACLINTDKSLQAFDVSINNGAVAVSSVSEHLELYYSALSEAAENQPALVSSVVQVILSHRGPSLGDGVLREKFVALEKRSVALVSEQRTASTPKTHRSIPIRGR